MLLSEDTVKKRPELVKKIIAIVLVVPFAISFVFCKLQWYPATYVIDWMTDENGTYPLRSTTILCWILMMVPILVVLLLAVVVKKIFIKKS
jgi:hypothetical protein